MDARIYVAAAVVILLLIIVLYNKNKEHLGKPYFLDQMAMAYSDPTWFNYLGYERDISGMSSRDYYLENQMNSTSRVAPQYFKNNAQFVDHTNYMDMPIKYRPGVKKDDDPSSKIARNNTSAAQINSEINSNNMEELAYLKLNKIGYY